ncbi:MAG: hypothetical protein ETSY1_05170 [Candidatus Entotheonella factor]|uniref:Methyltransferase type 11 domain-containing protein n=1 Tax=Entotheonella factor TaxID=1429438 RepID=W4LVT1_ENTF1|nr:class I SAM-dependent methyltransferase [Candidatus Entotheonella palauensis]ETX02008.1 MAG: hypothetical protein ETSY1_05170 [Candidatus Entotheonella factor]
MNRQSTGSASNYYDAKVQSFFDIWGGEHIHFGIYLDGTETLAEASAKTVEKLYSLLSAKQPGARILDLGSAFGGPARFLASQGHHVTCVDLSTANNQVNQQLNAANGLDSITILEENFESLSSPDESFDMVWSQDAICHASNLEQVFREAYRVLKPGGEFALCNTCCGDAIPEDVLETLNKRNSLSLQTISDHSKLAASVGFSESVCLDMSEHPSVHYQKMLQGVHAKEGEMVERGGQVYFDRVVQSLEYWLGVCNEGHMTWGMWKFVK